MRAVFGFVLCLTLSFTFVTANASGMAELPGGQQYVADKIWVVNEYNASAYLTGQDQAGIAVTGVSSVDELCRRLGVIEVEPYYPGRLTKPALIREVSRMYIFTLADGIDAASVIGDLTADPHIELAELCYVPTLNYVPNDPRVSDQWYISFTGAYEAWDVVRGDTTRHAIIGIVDTGVHWDHPDLAANIWVNAGEDINHNGVFDNGDINYVDDDTNGFVDDVVGWDVEENDNSVIDDATPHGTAVAGCASAATDNGLLGAGFGFSARIMCVKAFGDQGSLEHAYEGIVYAAEMGAQIINCSWSTFTYNQAEQDLIDAAWETGALIVGSAGARGDTVRNYPAAYNHVMGVAATNQIDQRAYFSGYGSWIDICAPGMDILTTYGESGFQYYSGTSFSTAMVSGLAALVCTRYPSYSADQIDSVIEATADSVAYNNGTLGAGRIDCAEAVGFVIGIDNKPQAPDKFFLSQNYPNPFNARTIISYNLPRQSDVTLDIFNLLGRKVASLVSEQQEAGGHSVIWDAKNQSSGIYYYRLKAGDLSQSKRCLLIK
jgi:serine protease